jgi:hypothetical protein
MQLENFSRLPTVLISRILNFVAEHSAHPESACIYVVSDRPPWAPKDKSLGICGVAYEFAPTAYREFPVTLNRPTRMGHAVVIHIPPYMPYPRTTRHLPQTEEVTFHDMEEELVMVLAHELQHIKQFVEYLFLTDELGAEIDAESYAIGVLKKYRQWVYNEVSVKAA